MTEYEFKNICQLILTDKTNAALALQMIKKRPILKKQVEMHFQPLLDILGKKSLRSIPTLTQKIASKKYKSKELVQLLEWKEVYTILKDLPSIIIQLIDIKIVSENIGTLIQLKELFIHSTLIEQLPDSIGQLQNLTELSLRNNQLKKLPDSIGNLNRLKSLSLDNTKISSLPNNISLPNLEEIYVKNTTLAEHTSSIKNVCPDIKNIWV